MLNKKLSEVGATLFRGTNWVDDDNPTLKEAAEMEADATLDARRKQLSTTIGHNGHWVSWDEFHNEAARAEFDLELSRLTSRRQQKNRGG